MTNCPETFCPGWRFALRRIALRHFAIKQNQVFSFTPSWGPTFQSFKIVGDLCFVLMLIWFLIWTTAWLLFCWAAQKCQNCQKSACYGSTQPSKLSSMLTPFDPHSVYGFESLTFFWQCPIVGHLCLHQIIIPLCSHIPSEGNNWSYEGFLLQSTKIFQSVFHCRPFTIACHFCIS